MAKRFRDTKLSRQAWYRKLKPAFKCTWDFICDECDEIGLWSIDMDALAFFIGENIPLSDFIASVNSDRPDRPRVEMFGEDKVFITGFVEFQYGQLSENCVPHRKILLLLKKYDLYERVHVPYTKGIYTLKEKKGMDKEEEKEKDFGKSENLLPEVPKEPRRPRLKVETEKETALKEAYSDLVTNIQTLPDVTDQKREIAKFITENKPKFIEPYCDLWNISVKTYGISLIEAISEGRLKKFKTRIREPAFDFIKILSELKNSAYLQGKTTDWKADWDWIMDNDTNYLKIIEGKYRNNTN